MGLLREWRKKRRLRNIPLNHIFEPLYEIIKTFNEDIPASIEVTKKMYLKQEKVPIAKKLIKKKQRVAKDIVYKTHYGGIYDVTYKIILFGDNSLERTRLAQKFLTNLFKSDARMTLGVDFEVKSLEVDNRSIKLQIWDIFGEERFRFLLPTYVRGANGGLFIYDALNYSSLAHIDEWLMAVRKELKEEDSFPIVVVGIVTEIDDEWRISAEEAIKIARSRGVDGFIECSPRTGENVEETFEALTRLMLTRSGVV